MDSKVSQLLQPPKFEYTETRAGSKVRIYTRNGDRKRPIHGAWHSPVDDTWHPTSWLENGHYLDIKYYAAMDLKETVNEVA